MSATPGLLSDPLKESANAAWYQVLEKGLLGKFLNMKFEPAEPKTAELPLQV